MEKTIRQEMKVTWVLKAADGSLHCDRLTLLLLTAACIQDGVQ